MSLFLRLLLFIFGFGLLFVISNLLRNKRIQVSVSLFWIFSSLVLILMAISPEFFGMIANFFGFNISSNFIVAIVLGLLLIDTLLTSIIVNSHTRINTKLIQQLALQQKEIEDLIKNQK